MYSNTIGTMLLGAACLTCEAFLESLASVVQTMNSMASGMCMLTFTDMAIKYSLTVMDITAVTMAHIHSGAAGKPHSPTSLHQQMCCECASCRKVSLMKLETLFARCFCLIPACHCAGANGPVLAYLYKSPMMPPATTTMNGPLSSVRNLSIVIAWQREPVAFLPAPSHADSSRNVCEAWALRAASAPPQGLRRESCGCARCVLSRMMCLQGMLMSKDFVGPAKNMTVMAFYNM